MLMLVICAFGREEIPDEQAVRIEIDNTSTNICPKCLTLIIVHRRIHRMPLEKLISQMAE